MRRMEELEKKVEKTINTYGLIEQGDKIILGVSGGPDSMCMLSILFNLSCQTRTSHVANFEIVVAHVNHMIREEAKDEEDFVRRFCEEKNIGFYAKSIDVKKLANTNKIGTEEAGRNARYEFFEELRREIGANKIAIAHNKNDKIETMMMNLLRGSGVSGLKGMEIKRKHYIRPLLECERTEIEKYCEQNNIEPKIDKTNFENIYTRNKIRNIVIPYIKKEFNPNIMDTMDRLSILVGEEEEYFEKIVKKVYESILIEEKEKEIQLDLKEFNKEEKVIKARVILYTITRLFGSSKGIEKIHIEDIIQLCKKNIGNKYLTPNKNIKILIKNHKIYFSSQI